MFNFGQFELRYAGPGTGRTRPVWLTQQNFWILCSTVDLMVLQRALMLHLSCASVFPTSNCSDSFYKTTLIDLFRSRKWSARWSKRPVKATQRVWLCCKEPQNKVLWCPAGPFRGAHHFPLVKLFLRQCGATANRVIEPPPQNRRILSLDRRSLFHWWFKHRVVI